MSSTSKVLPLFVSGKAESVRAAVGEGGVLHDLDGIAYAYIKDLKQYWYISIDHEIFPISGDNKQQVQRVDALPANGDPEVLYILNTTVYQWDSETQTYIPTYHDVSDQLNAVTELVSTLSTTVSELATEVAAKPSMDDVNVAINAGVEAAEQYADSLVGGFDDRITANENAISTVQTNMTTMQGQIAALQEESSETEEQIVIVQQEAKEYTDSKSQELKDYIDSTFELKEV